MNHLKEIIRSTRDTLKINEQSYTFFRLDRLEEAGFASIQRLPYSIRILLENAIRHYDGEHVSDRVIHTLANWEPHQTKPIEIPYMPARVILQDFTGVPAVVDLAAMRSAMARIGGDPAKINPHIPVDLVIDHSVQIDFFGTGYAFRANVEREYERNRERYLFLKWAQQSFKNFRVVPPGTGIVHQVNLEFLATVVQTRTVSGERYAFPDTLLGTDSHTTMINGLGVLGWGVGGIEAEAVMLGQPYFMLVPEVIGVKLTGRLPEGATATDLVLTLTRMLREYGVVGKFVEYFGPGLAHLSLPDRATVANMSPEYGATMGFFPVDEETLRYLENTGRSPELVELVRRYTQKQGLFRTDAAPQPEYTDVLELDMSTVEPSLAGPKNPEELIPLTKTREAFKQHLKSYFENRGIKPNLSAEHAQWQSEGGACEDPNETTTQTIPALKVDPETGVRSVAVSHGNQTVQIGDGSIVIAAITSCTNTSNPSVMIGAGLLARNAVIRGLQPPPYVKTSLAPGSQIVSEYLKESGLLPYLEAIRFHLVGYGCTTCIGNSGPLPDWVAAVIRENELAVAAVLSGNRNFEGRINPLVRFNYLASPMLVVAYALAGRMDIDLTREPLGFDPNGKPVYLQDIWPSMEEIQNAIHRSLKPELFHRRYGRVFEGDELWQALKAPQDQIYAWDPQSTYIQEPPFFVDLPLEPSSLQDIIGARVLALLGDRITTDHISPAGAIPEDSPAGRYLIEHGVQPRDFNSFGSRRGNHEVMMRGTFGNIRLRNRLVPDKEGGWTVYWPTGEITTIYEAAMKYRETNTPLLILAGKQYGTGSSRDWAAKGTALLGVRAVIAQSYERIHRSNLIGMGVLPLEFKNGENADTLGLDGSETYDITGIHDDLQPGESIKVIARHAEKGETTFEVRARLDSQAEVEYYRHGGILQMVLRRLLQSSPTGG